ncbi:TVP38/TMEM64 family protein [Luteitalea sp.]|uniref:TVP38/TMEM64 family protein n=1 Tax=Luteitalea sp. TaxID=2004800 RepID=UPI0037C9CBA4
MAPLTRGAALRAALGLALLVAGVLVARSQVHHVASLLLWVRGLGWLAPVVFGAIYALAVPFAVPGSLLTLTAGALFGLWPGVPVVFCASTVGSSLAFLVARHVARPWVEAWAAGHPRFAAVDRAVSAEGTRMVFLLRLTPLVPFTVLNYLLGLTRIRWRDMVLASPGTLPGTFLYVYYGHVIGDVAAVAAGARPPRSPAQYAILATGLVAAVLVAMRVAAVARRALTDTDLAPAREA